MSEKEEITNSTFYFKLALIYFSFNHFHIISLEVKIFLLRISVLKDYGVFFVSS